MLAWPRVFVWPPVNLPWQTNVYLGGVKAALAHARKGSTMKRLLQLAMSAFVSLVVFPSLICAQSALIMPRPIPGVRGAPLNIESCSVDIDIEKQVAAVHADIVFRNQLGRQIEGTFLFPLPEASAIHDFSMYANGKKLEGEILKKEQAREIYDRIVGKLRDPALLEYVGQDLFQASIFPIPANDKVRVELDYEQLLKRDSGLTEVTYPIRTTRSDAKPLGELVIDVELSSDIPLKSIYSPTHDVDTVRKSDHKARVGFEGDRVQPDRDFVLYYATSEEEFGCNLIASRERREDGFFLVLLAPKTRFSEEEIPAKDVVFVFDTSGSMAGKKIDQACKALVFCLDNLNRDDRFNVITFATGLREFADDVVAATDDNVEDAIEFVEKMKARGGTNIEESMVTALETLADSSRPAMVLFLTDGYPTVGETDIGELTDLITEANEGKGKSPRRVFTFGVGDEINAQFLDRVTRDNSGAAEYVRPAEDIEIKVSSLYGKISHPVLTDIEMKMDGVRTYDVYPAKLGDLFCGTELRVLGRYEDEGDAKLVLTGQGADGDRRFTYDVYLPRAESAHGFVPRLWAIRKVGYLLDEIRLKGENKELKDEIVDLALTYGIVTPYTSFLVNEDEQVIARRPEETRRAFREAQHAHDFFGGELGYGGGYGGLAASTYSGAQARGRGMMMPGMMMPGRMDAGMMGGAGGLGAPPRAAAPAEGLVLGRATVEAEAGDKAIVAAQGIRGMQVNDSELILSQRNVQNIGRSTFYYDPETETWCDSRYDPKLKTVEIQRDSEAFRQVVMARPELARYLAQGPRVVYRMAAVNLRVGDAGLTDLTDTQLQELLR